MWIHFFFFGFSTKSHGSKSFSGQQLFLNRTHFLQRESGMRSRHDQR